MEPGVCAPYCSGEMFLKGQAFVTLYKVRYFLKGMDFTFPVVTRPPSQHYDF